MFRLHAVASVLMLVTLAVAACRAQAHEGHNHGAPPPSVSLDVAPRVEATSDAYELVAIARDGGLELWLDDFATNAPIDGAVIEVDARAGTETAQSVDAGRYRLAAPWISEPGPHDLIFTITHREAVDILTATLVIPGAKAGAERPGSARSRAGAALDRASDILQGTAVPSLLAVGTGGFLAGLMVMGVSLRMLGRRRPPTGTRAAATAVSLLLLLSSHPAMAQGRDQAQRLADGSVFVPKSTQRILAIRTAVTDLGAHARVLELPGRIIPDPDASGVVVAAVAGRLMAPPGGFPRLGTRVKAGEILARVEPALQAIDASDVQQRAGELDQQIAIVRRRLDRLQAVRDAVTRAQVEETVLELAGLQDRRRRLDTVRRTSEALVAPVAGVVAATHAVAGQIAEPNAVIFRIADPARLWVEALSFEPVPVATTASARLADGRSLELHWRGAGLSAVQQAIPVHFAIQSDTGRLRAGQMVRVFAPTGEARDGIALPRDSILRGGNGQNLVWEHVAAERFEPREVRFEPLDGTRALVVAGLTPGRRIVTQGAELLNQVR